jgi:hypothetical protein
MTAGVLNASAVMPAFQPIRLYVYEIKFLVCFLWDAQS